MKKRRENIKKFPKKSSLFKQMNEKERAKGKRKSQRAKERAKWHKTVIENNHTKTHPVLIFRYQHKKAP